MGHKTVALTDHGAVNAVFDAYKYAKTQGIKLIAGNEFYFRNDMNDEDERGNKHIVLIARNQTGWQNILKLNYLGWQRQKVIFSQNWQTVLFILTTLWYGLIPASLLHLKISLSRPGLLLMKIIVMRFIFWANPIIPVIIIHC